MFLRGGLYRSIENSRLVEIEFLHFFFENLNWSKSFLDFLDSSGRIIHAVLHDVSRYDMLGNRYGGLQIN